MSEISDYARRTARRCLRAADLAPAIIQEVAVAAVIQVAINAETEGLRAENEKLRRDLALQQGENDNLYCKLARIELASTEGQPAVEYHIVPPNELIAENQALREAGNTMHKAGDKFANETQEGDPCYREYCDEFDKAQDAWVALVDKDDEK